MRNLIFALTVILVGFTAFAGVWMLDPINRFQTEIWNGPMWAINGFFTPIKLGPEAIPDEVLTRALHATSWKTGSIHHYRIREIKTIYVMTTPYTAVLFDSDQGKKIMWMRYEKDQAYWWEHFYDVTP